MRMGDTYEKKKRMGAPIFGNEKVADKRKTQIEILPRLSTHVSIDQYQLIRA